MDHGPVLAQIYVQVSYAVMYLLSRVVLQQGMSQYIFVFFRQCIGSLAITTVLLFLPSNRPVKLTLRDIGKLSVQALIGITVSSNLNYSGLSLTSTTFATTMANLSPASTYLMALAFKMEKFDLSNQSGRAKILGTAICVIGATFMSMFKGPVIFGEQTHRSETNDWMLGALLSAGGVWTWSLCLIYQSWITLDCPSQLTSTVVMCWIGALQSGLVALLFVRTPGEWRVNWDLQLLTVTYGGIFCSAIGFFVLMWCAKKKGPLFASIFTPLSNVIVAILEPLLLHVPLRWGSFAGMVMVIGGLYCVLWGKASEEEAARLHVPVTCETTEPQEEFLLISSAEITTSDAAKL